MSYLCPLLTEPWQRQRRSLVSQQHVRNPSAAHCQAVDTRVPDYTVAYALLAVDTRVPDYTVAYALLAVDTRVPDYTVTYARRQFYCYHLNYFIFYHCYNSTGFRIYFVTFRNVYSMDFLQCSVLKTQTLDTE